MELENDIAADDLLTGLEVADPVVRELRPDQDEVTGPERTRGRRKRNMQVGAVWAIGVMS